MSTKQAKKFLRDLAKTVLSYPCLYDSLNIYTKNDKVEAWEEIAGHLSSYSVSAGTCQKKWTSMRNQFRLKGDTYFLSRELSFLLPHMRDKTSDATVNDSEDSSYQGDEPMPQGILATNIEEMIDTKPYTNESLETFSMDNDDSNDDISILEDTGQPSSVKCFKTSSDNSGSSANGKRKTMPDAADSTVYDENQDDHQLTTLVSVKLEGNENKKLKVSQRESQKDFVDDPLDQFFQSVRTKMSKMSEKSCESCREVISCVVTEFLKSDAAPGQAP